MLVKTKPPTSPQANKVKNSMKGTRKTNNHKKTRPKNPQQNPKIKNQTPQDKKTSPHNQPQRQIQKTPKKKIYRYTKPPQKNA
ncbi:hypothetical protein ACQWFX_24460, partial [Salmonella enterica subsp. enterica serovar Infantis]